MNNIKTIENIRPVGGDYFRLWYSISSNKYLKDFLPLFNFDDYWCYKITNTQRQFNYDEFLKFEFSGYIFFKKNIYSKENIEEWIKFSKKYAGRDGLQYLSKPTPPFNPNKIKIRK